MLETLLTCPLCGEQKFSNYLTCADYMVTKEKFDLKRCDNCHFIFTNPRPDIHSISKYYESNEYISHSNLSNNLINSIYKIARKFTVNHKLKLITKLKTEKNILDFGCGTGQFLNVCSKNGWQINGFEPNNSAAKQAENTLQKTIFKSIDEVSNLPKVNLITMWHVLEHIHDLQETLSLLISKLEKNGKILIAVPNYKSYDANKYKKYWAAYDVPRHLYHFEQESMQKLLKLHDLKIIKTIPMKLDSFYVSLLSEKYKKNNLIYLNSIVNGWLSNVYAHKTLNFSSLIYIAERC